MKRRKLRTRILAWFVGLTAILLGGFSATLWVQTRSALMDRVDGALSARAETLAMRVESEWGRITIEPEEVAGAGSQDEEETVLSGAVHAFPEGTLVGFAGPGKVDEAALKAAVEPWLGSPGTDPAASPPFTSVRRGSGAALRIFTGIFTIPDEGKGPPGTRRILVSTFADLKEVRETLNELVVSLATVGAAALIAAVFCGWYVARRIAGPVEAIARAAETVQASDLSGGVPGTGSGDEIDRLAGVLNGTFARLREAFERQTRFTADASHELRNPVAVIKSHSEIALSREREPGEYREALEEILAASDRLQGLLESLLFLARADNRTLQASFEDLDFADLARESAAAFEKEAAERSVAMEVSAEAPVRIHGDRVLLSMLLGNLLSNALRHSRAGGMVRISAAVKDGVGVLSVSDDGEGIPPEHLPRIFERFFRSDEGRAREAGGTGLGLAIVKTVADVHGAELAAESRPGEGTVVRVSFDGSGRTSSST